MTPSDHAARAPSEAAVSATHAIWAPVIEYRALALAFDAFALAARKQAMEDIERQLNTLRGMALLHRDRDYMLMQIDAIEEILAQEESP